MFPEGWGSPHGHCGCGVGLALINQIEAVNGRCLFDTAEFRSLC